MTLKLDDLNIRRLYYSTSEVSEIVQVPPHELRIWEEKFPYFKASKSKSGRRLFRPKVLKAGMLIKKLHEEAFTDEQIVNLLRLHNMNELESMDLLSDGKKLKKIMLLSDMYTDLKEILFLVKKK